MGFLAITCQGGAMLASVVRMLLPLVSLLLKGLLPQGRWAPTLVLVQAPLLPSNSHCFVRVRSCTAWPWTTRSRLPADRQLQWIPVDVQAPSLLEVLSNWLSLSSSPGKMFLRSGGLEVQQQQLQSRCQIVTPQGPTLLGSGRRTTMLASPAALMGVMNVRTASWRLGHACGASMPQAAQPFSLSSCGSETNRCVAASSILGAAQVVLLPPIRMFEFLACCTCGHNNPNSFRGGCRGCKHTVCVTYGYAVHRVHGAPTWSYCHLCCEAERQSIAPPDSTAQSSGPTLPQLLKEGHKLAEELKLRKSPLKAPEVPMGGHKGDSRGLGAEDA